MSEDAIKPPFERLYTSKSLLSMSLATAPPLGEAGQGASIVSSMFPSLLCGTTSSQTKINAKSAPSSSSSKVKQKTKKKSNQLVQETIPLNDIRRTYPRLIETIMNRGQVEDCENKLSSICVKDSSFLLIISAIEREHPYGPIYQEIHGIEAAAKCINAYFSAIPDSVFAIVDSKFYKKPIGSEIHCNFSFSGSVIHRIVIEDIEQMNDISNAILGLQTLAQVAIDREYLPTTGSTDTTKEQHDFKDTDRKHNIITTAIDGQPNNEDGPPTDIISPATSSNQDSSSQTHEMESSNIGMKRHYSIDQQPLVIPTGKKRLSVGELDFFVDKDDNFISCDQLIIATNKTKFKIGERMQSSRSFTTNGKITFTLNADKLVQKLEVTYSSRTATQSSRYVDDTQIDR